MGGGAGGGGGGGVGWSGVVFNHNSVVTNRPGTFRGVMQDPPVIPPRRGELVDMTRQRLVKLVEIHPVVILEKRVKERHTPGSSEDYLHTLVRDGGILASLAGN